MPCDAVPPILLPPPSSLLAGGVVGGGHADGGIDRRLNCAAAPMAMPNKTG